MLDFSAAGSFKVKKNKTKQNKTKQNKTKQKNKKTFLHVLFNTVKNRRLN